MDAVKILGSLLGGGGMGRGGSGDLVGGLLRQAMGGGGGGGGGLGDLIGSALGGGGGGGLGGLGAALGGGGSGGGLGGLGAALGGGRSSGGGLGGILGSVAVAAITKYAASQMSGGGGGAAGLAGLLGGGSDGQMPDPVEAMGLSAPQANQQAELLIEAMVGAAKADGRIDPDEERAIMDRLGDLDAEETAMIRRAMSGPADPRQLAQRVPRGMEQSVYAMSLLAMDVDERSEASYLHQLAQGLGLSAEQCNAMHREMNEPEIFR